MLDILRQQIKTFPKRPGVYVFKNAQNEIIYIGKAKNLHSRIRQYFAGTDERLQIPFLLKEAKNIEYTLTQNELEALYLERNLIQTHKPKYNIDLRDDKNYAFIKIDYTTQIPQITYARKILHLGQDKYFGPYTAAGKIRETLATVRKIFSYCSAQKVSNKPCFYYHLHRCPGVCVGKISLNEYQTHLEKIVQFLKGNTSVVIKAIQKEMQNSAKQKKFETAARLRDQLRALNILLQKQNAVLAKKVDWDIVSIALSISPSPNGRGRPSDGQVRVSKENIPINNQKKVGENTYACINLFKIRSGKMQGKENFVYGTGNKPESTENYENILQNFLEQYYLETSSLPKAVYLQYQPKDVNLIKQIFRTRIQKSVPILIPQKGQIKKLINLGRLNAQEYLKNYLNNKADFADQTLQALTQLQKVLNLKNTPKRIECYDISNTQGTNAVGSMVVFTNGLPDKNQYRKFKIQGKDTPDDFAMMQEMLSRRLSHSLKIKPLNLNSKTQINLKSEILNLKLNQWPMPDLIVIDGGKGQLNAVLASLKAKSYQLKAIPVIGLAKRIEEIFLPNKKNPITLPHDQPALQLLQRIRDEAHRFGITFHRKLRSKQAVKSALDDIPGIGPKTKKLLKTNFGTLANIKQATLADLTKIVGKNLANKIHQTL